MKSIWLGPGMDELGAGAVNLDVGGLPTGHEFVLRWTAPDEVREVPTVGVATGFGA